MIIKESFFLKKLFLQQTFTWYFILQLFTLLLFALKSFCEIEGFGFLYQLVVYLQNEFQLNSNQVIYNKFLAIQVKKGFIK